MEEFSNQFETFVQSARDLYQTSNPKREFDRIKESIHALHSTCLMLNIDNLVDFFRAFEEFLSKIAIKSRNIPYALNKALDVGYKKLMEINEVLRDGKSKEKMEKIFNIETLVEVESFYSYSP